MMYEYGTNRSSGKEREPEVIEAMTFDQWKNVYDQMCNHKSRGYKREMARLANYYKRQRMIGVIILLSGIFLAVIGSAAAWKYLCYVAIGLVAVGVFVMFTKNMLYVDKYYIEHRERVKESIC